jgi:hypothetical protein
MDGVLRDHHEILERICRRGCRGVLAIIAEMERGAAPEDVAQLPPAERNAILVELKAIMAVYDGECGVGEEGGAWTGPGSC